MKAVFVDTNYWVALIDPRDAFHSEANRLAATCAGQPQVTSELVFVELLNHFSNSGALFRRAAVALIADLRASSHLDIVPLSSGQFDAAMKLYGERADKAWSLVDCSSFQIMRRRRLADALAYDRHFLQAGFRALLRPSP